MKIRNITDVITNSSDEIYIFKSNSDPIELVKELKELLGPDPTCSGMGGILEAWSSSTGKGNLRYKEDYEDLPKGYLILNVDNGYLKTLKNAIIEKLGKPLLEDELNELFKSIDMERYKRYSEQFRSLKGASEEKYTVWTEWLYYREATESTDTGYQEDLKDVREYVEAKIKEIESIVPEDSWEKIDNEYRISLYKEVIESINIEIDHEDS